MLVTMRETSKLGLGISKYQNSKAPATESCPPTLDRLAHMLSTANRPFIGININFQYIVHNIMLSNYHTLSYIASSLHLSLQNRRISQIYSQSPDEMVIAFDPGVPSLIFCCESDLVGVFLHGRTARAKSNSADLLTEAWGRSVTGVAIQPSDRVVTLSLASRGSIVLAFFGAQSNAFLVDSANRILDAFKKPRQFTGRSFPIHHEELLFDLTGLVQKLRSHPEATIAAQIKKLFPTLGTTLVREVLVRCAIAPGAAVGDIQESGLGMIPRALRGLLAEASRPSPRIYYDRDGTPSVFSVVPLTHLEGMDERSFDDIHDAVRTFVFRRRAGTRLHSAVSALHAPLQRALSKLLRTRTAMEDEAREARHSEEYERYGSLIMLNLSAINKGDATLTTAEGTIPLDRALTPVHNAQRYFEKAKRSRAAAADKQERLISIDNRLRMVKNLLQDLDLVATQEDLEAFRTAHTQSLALFGLTQESKARIELPFRTFLVDGGFEVWAGKNSENNDLLTMKHARPNDLWFHARGSGGSHVVLKLGSGKGEPSRRAIEQAAAIAAYYSKMKTSTLVPVAMTERKHVRKPRGAPAGTVALEREKVIFVRPQLPSRGTDTGSIARHQHPE
jgi:predicted ribosome quality control (RQC) complex YloA/Tae2 family protein